MAGEKEFGHDDFIVGEFENKNGKCIAVHLNNKRYGVYSEDYGHYVIGVNKEFGLLEDK